MNILIAAFFLSLFGFFNILGIKQALIGREIIYIIVGIFAYFITKKISRHFIRDNAVLFYWFLIILLIITYIIGFEIKGSKRWIDLYFFNFQASEFLKIFFILFLASYLAKDAKYINSFAIFIKSLLYFLLPFLIIFKQPDLGNAMAFIFIYLMMILFSDLPKKYLINFIIFLVIILPFGWTWLKPYQKERIFSFLNPQIDQQGNAYNMIQAMITIGSGKFFGRGLGAGTQSRLLFLPENHTDFAFSSLVEQFGFIGGLTVLILYLVIIYALVKKALKFYYQKESARGEFLYLIGFITYFVFQITVNIGMNLGILPVVGVALPFISYGGSLLMALMVGFALIP